MEEQEIIAHALEIAPKDKGTATTGAKAEAGDDTGAHAAAVSAPAAAGVWTPVSD